MLYFIFDYYITSNMINLIFKHAKYFYESLYCFNQITDLANHESYLLLDRTRLDCMICIFLCNQIVLTI